MSRAPKFILCYREYIGKKSRAYGGKVDSYGPWIVVSRTDTFPHPLPDPTVGMKQWEVRYRGGVSARAHGDLLGWVVAKAFTKTEEPNPLSGDIDQHG